LKQVLINLMSNAVKYNRDRGRVTVARTPLDDGWLRISVTDTGYGIPADLHDRLFNPFDRLGAERGAVEGTGLGLALSKGLVEAMGGRLSFSSQPDVGSTFWIDLATTESALDRFERTSSSRRIGRAAATAVAARTILHIEDNRTNRRLVERIVNREGLGRVVDAGDAAAGLRLAHELRPDVILLDLHLPDADGRAVLGDLRRRPETRAIPVVVLSADGSKAQIRRLLAEGAVGYLTKPIQVEEFVALLERLLGSSPDRT
jgi:CheY-like chemotaxis protein